MDFPNLARPMQPMHVHYPVEQGQSLTNACNCAIASRPIHVSRSFPSLAMDNSEPLYAVQKKSHGVGLRA